MSHSRQFFLTTVLILVLMVSLLIHKVVGLEYTVSDLEHKVGLIESRDIEEEEPTGVVVFSIDMKELY